VEGLLPRAPFAALAAAAVARFTLVDVGCSGGIDPAWRVFGERLRAFAFDPDLDDMARLAAAETLPGVRFVPGFVGVRPDGAYAAAHRSAEPWSRNPWQRLSVQRSIEHIAARNDAAAKAGANLWQQKRLADPAAPLLLHEYLPAQGVTDVDFLKIDVDSVDMGILDSVGDELAAWGVLGVGLEVNYFGSDDATDHTFHAMDRFMRARGFDLFGLSVRRYSLDALPAPYKHGTPGESSFGRPLQGDAVYLRDPGAGLDHHLPADKLLKLAAIAALAGVPDLAADILLRHRDGLAPLLDVSRGLDLLAAQAQPGVARPLGHADYLAAFSRNDVALFTPTPTPPSPADAATAVLHARLAAMEASSSWRLTAPLRRIAWLLGRR